MRVLAKFYIGFSIALGALAILGSFGNGDVPAFSGGVMFIALAIMALRFINITEKYEKVTKEIAEEERIGSLVDQRLKERQ